jgi:hypothetical protein
MMTVALEYPPLDIDETFNRWVKSGGKKTELE